MGKGGKGRKGEGGSRMGSFTFFGGGGLLRAIFFWGIDEMEVAGESITELCEGIRYG